MKPHKWHPEFDERRCTVCGRLFAAGDGVYDTDAHGIINSSVESVANAHAACAKKKEKK